MRGIEQPDHVAVVGFPRHDVLGANRRMLQLDNNAAVADYVRPVGAFCHLHELRAHQVLPPDVPWPDWLRPGIAVISALVCPVVGVDLATLSDQQPSAARTKPPAL